MTAARRAFSLLFDAMISLMEDADEQRVAAEAREAQLLATNEQLRDANATLLNGLSSEREARKRLDERIRELEAEQRSYSISSPPMPEPHLVAFPEREPDRRMIRVEPTVTEEVPSEGHSPATAGEATRESELQRSVERAFAALDAGYEEDARLELLYLRRALGTDYAVLAAANRECPSNPYGTAMHYWVERVCQYCGAQM